MPNYTYYCNKCNLMFEIFSHIKDYTDKPKCIECQLDTDTCRMYDVDFRTQSASVKKSDSELKTLGDLANRNRDKLSDDHKAHLQLKHNAYKEQGSTKELPSGMTRLKKQPKTKWID